jgi:hypothetical protein
VPTGITGTTYYYVVVTNTLPAATAQKSVSVTSSFATVTVNSASVTLDLSSKIGQPQNSVKPSPAQGGNIMEATEYTGTVVWSHPAEPGKTELYDPQNNMPWGEMVYTATLTLTAKSGYSFDGVAANAFTYSGAQGTDMTGSIPPASFTPSAFGHGSPAGTTYGQITNAAGSGNTITVTIVFPKTTRAGLSLGFNPFG